MAEQTARHLHADLVQYEVMLNHRIAQEQELYEKRLTICHDEESELLTHNLEQFRRHRSAELASAMSADPAREVQIGSVIHFLNDSVRAEYGLYQRLREKEATATVQYNAAMEKLGRHRDRLIQIEEQVAGLSTKSRLRNNSKLLMGDTDELLDELEKDLRH